MTNVDPEEFAAQVNYLAAIGRMVVPRAFAFASLKVLFVGHGPFDPEDTAALLPESAEWWEHDTAPEGFVPHVIVLGREGFEKGSIKAAIGKAAGSPKVIPQEGFVDELLFGHDWWTDKTSDLEALVGTHRGLQSARAQGALKPAGISMPTPKKETPKAARRSAPKLAASQIISRYRDLLSQPFGTIPEKPNETQRTPPTDFSWPSAEAVESRGGDNAYDLRARSRLKELGYDTNQSPSARWRILRDEAVPELGLARVAGLIAWFCRSRKQQRGGRQKYARAIAEWEHDLDRLRRELYSSHRPRFTWPSSEP